ncbi:hypothetical protein AB6F62_10740 [Providencia huaxiensis]|uniref:hypothetical protein n=1 Tax=Providencia huaxiensis TaxID=2027290 RepID=UPI0034DD4F79
MKKMILLFCLASSPVLAADQQININVHGYVAVMPCELETINHVIDLKKSMFGIFGIHKLHRGLISQLN